MDYAAQNYLPPSQVDFPTSGPSQTDYTMPPQGNYSVPSQPDFSMPSQGNYSAPSQGDFASAVTHSEPPGFMAHDQRTSVTPPPHSNATSTRGETEGGEETDQQPEETTEEKSE